MLRSGDGGRRLGGRLSKHSDKPDHVVWHRSERQRRVTEMAKVINCECGVVVRLAKPA